MPRDLPSLNAMRAFEAAARLQSFSRAADELSVTQSAVSRQIQKLEAELGQPLFARNGPHLKLTDRGREYYGVVQQGLGVIKRGTERLFRHVGARADDQLHAVRSSRTGSCRASPTSSAATRGLRCT